MQIGWIDYSKEHRDRVMSVLDSLIAPGAVDELGISVVRDAFSDRLFPGMSTLQTRAKYFLIVPWIMRELEHQGLSPKDFDKQLHKEEIQMIKVLLDNGENEDVIGRRSREALKRKPSEIYWTGLRTFGLFRDYHMSMPNYISVANRVNHENTIRKAGLLKGEEQHDDCDAFSPEMIRSFWDVPEPPPDWKEKMRFKFQYDESVFLRDKIITSAHSGNSLLAYILAQCSEDACKCHAFEDLAILDMPSDIRVDYELARDFAQLIHGAHLRYNIALFRSIDQQEKVDAIQPKWNEWKETISSYNLDKWDTYAMFDRLHITSNKHAYYFICQWIEKHVKHLDTVSEDELDNFITKREVQLKGRERTKINGKPASYGEWVGISGLQYRWPNARQIIKDISEGLGGI